MPAEILKQFWSSWPFLSYKIQKASEKYFLSLKPDKIVELIQDFRQLKTEVKCFGLESQEFFCLFFIIMLITWL